MKEKKSRKNEREEDFFVNATLKVQAGVVDNVLCKVFLPERVTDKPLLKFKPTKEQYADITTSHEGAFEAKIIGFNKEREVSLNAPNVYFSKMVTKHWGPEFSESSFDGVPQHLQVVRHISSNAKTEKTSLTIWLSPNPMLEPAMSKTSHYTGDVEFKRVNQLEFPLLKDLTIKFDKHFKSKELEDHETKQWSYLVAYMDVDIPAKEIPSFQVNIIPQIDAFLTVASLGSRTRTAWVGWEASDYKDITEYYRGNFTFPSGQSEHSFDQGLVWLKDFRDFLLVSYPTFLKHPNKKAIQNAIISVVPGRKKVLEESFLSMFAGLEALILDFRRRENFEFVIPEFTKWETIKKRIKKK